jgi:hypothetical protein
MRYLAQRMVAYWNAGIGNHSIPNRSEALEVVEVATELNEVLAAIETRTGQQPLKVATSARQQSQEVAYTILAEKLATETQPVVLIFGTAYGLCRRVIESCDYTLPPIRAGSWNHLSVRSAVAITLERLVGEK